MVAVIAATEHTDQPAPAGMPLTCSEIRRLQAQQEQIPGLLRVWNPICGGCILLDERGGPLRFFQQQPQARGSRFLPGAQLPGGEQGFLCLLGATLALAAGVHPKVVQERLGHATISITLDIYSHVTTGLHSDAAEQVAGLVFGGR